MSYKIVINITGDFDNWLSSLKSARARNYILAKLRAFTLGDFAGDRAVENNIYEARIDYSRGYRLYYKKHGNAVIVMRGSGYRSEREKDIAAVKIMMRGL